MKTLVLGAGIIGISTAWHLLERGHEVIVVDRQPDAALETSFANAAQISVSYCEPWANRQAPAKLLKWMFRNDAPLLFRPQLDWQQWRWGLQFLSQCHDAAFERNVRQLVALGSYSHAALKDVVRATGIEYQRLERGIAHFYTVAHLTALTALKQIDREFDWVAQSLRVPFHRMLRQVTIPICLPAILDIAVYLFVNALTTVSAVIFLYGADTKLAALTRSGKGSVIVSHGETVAIPVHPVAKVVDTTGAGDLFAAGFLTGLARGASYRNCALLGAMAAAEVIQHIGARPESDLRQMAEQAQLL